MEALKWGFRVLVLNCPQLPTIVKRPKTPQMCIIADDCARVAKSGLKPPLKSPHLFKCGLPHQSLCRSTIIVAAKFPCDVAFAIGTASDLRLYSFRAAHLCRTKLPREVSNGSAV